MAPHWMSSGNLMRQFGLPVVAFLLAIVVWITETNVSLFYQLNALHWVGGDSVWAVITLFGDGSIVLPLALILLRYKPKMLVSFFITALITTVVVQSLKYGLMLPRPGAVIIPADFHVIGPLYTTKSFPSGHTATAFAWAGLIVMNLGGTHRRVLWVSLIVLAATLVGMSRMVVGVHWPLDVLVGAGIGWLCGAMGFALGERSVWMHKPAPMLGLTVFFVLVALYCLFLFRNDYDVVDEWHTGIVVFSLVFGLYPQVKAGFQRVISR